MAYSVLLQMIKLYEQNPDCCIVAIEEVAASEVDKYGVIDGELLEGSNNAYRVHNMVEKPTPTANQRLACVNGMP
jgi:UTP--glucose-1-phosphate uridylyltransferase